MILLSPEQYPPLRGWFLPEQPGRLVGLHILNTGNGALFADRWPAPQALAASTAGSCVLLGDPQALACADLQQQLRGSAAAGAGFVPRLAQAFPRLRAVEKIVFVLSAAPGRPARPATGNAALIRRLDPADRHHLWGLSPACAWITRSWGGPGGLAASGYAWGAFVDGRLAALACGYYLGEKYVDVAVATEPELRGQGLSTACAAALCGQLLARGVQPIWNAAADHPASLRIAEKLGFQPAGSYWVYYAG